MVWSELRGISTVSRLLMGECTKCRAWVQNIAPYTCNCPKERECEDCGLTKNIEQFYIDKRANYFDKGKFFPRKYKYCCAMCARKKVRSTTIMKRKNMVRPAKGTPCDWCGDWRKNLVFEHDHKSGKFRGWLCTKCNTGLGLLGDGPEIIEKAKKYFARTEKEAIQMERPIISDRPRKIRRVNTLSRYFTPSTF